MSIAAVALAVLASAGCTAESGPPDTSTSAPSSPAVGTPTGGPAPTTSGPGTPQGDPLSIHRTGGFVGVDQRLVVQAGGGWTYTDRGGNPQRGSLSATQLDRLRQLVGDPRLAVEARTPPQENCADGFVYDLAVGDLAARYVDCGSSTAPPTISAIVTLLVDATPL